MGAYFLRNDGLRLSGEPGPADVVAAFRAKFDYPDDSDSEFDRLFTTEQPDGVSFAWFEPFQPASEAALVSSEREAGSTDA